MKFQIIFALIAAAFAMTACSGSSNSASSGPLPKVSVDSLGTQSFKAEKVLNPTEYSQITSGWYTNCSKGFDPTSIGANFKIEETLFTAAISYSRLFNEQILAANTNEMHSLMTYQNLSFGGFSGQVLTDNSSDRICKYSSGSNGSSVECNESGHFTAEAIEYLSHMPKDPEDSCSDSTNWKVQTQILEQGTYVFDNGLRVPAISQKVQSTYDTVCNGQTQTRTVSYVQIQTTGIKNYPDYNLSCAATVFQHSVRQDQNNRTQLEHMKRFQQAPLK